MMVSRIDLLSMYCVPIYIYIYIRSDFPLPGHWLERDWKNRNPIRSKLRIINVRSVTEQERDVAPW